MGFLLCNPLIMPLCVLFSFAFNSGQIPDDWRVAMLRPIFKKGSSTACRPTSYRPISLTSCFCKLFERILKESVLEFLLNNNLISRHQHGFLSKSSTCAQLLESVNDRSLAISNRRLSDVIYYDFSKAFDFVNHPNNLQVVRMWFNWQTVGNFGCILSNKLQRVVIDNVCSPYEPVTSGMTQGSVLGPLLFLLFINDVTDLFDVTVNVKLYADDIKMHFEIVNNANVDCLQKGINDLSTWAENWQLKLSVDK